MGLKFLAPRETPTPIFRTTYCYIINRCDLSDELRVMSCELRALANLLLRSDL